MKTGNSIKILFFLKKAQLLQNGEASICMRITVNAGRAEMMIKRSVIPPLWDQEKERVKGSDVKAKEINAYIESLTSNINTLFARLEYIGEPVTAQTVRDLYQGKKSNPKDKTLIGLYEEHNSDVWALVGKGFAEVTAKKFDTSLARLKEFVLHYCRRKDIPLKQVDNQFIRKFEIYLKTKIGCHHNTAIKHLKEPFLL